MKGAAIVALVFAALIAMLVVDARKRPQRDAKAAAAAEVLIDGKAATVHILTDKVQGKTWRLIYIDRGAVILPGPGQAIAVEKP